MRSLLYAGLGALAVAALGCSEQTAPPTAEAEAAGVPASGASPAQSTRHFVSLIRGAAEVPPVATDAVGSAGFNVRGGGEAIDFLLLIGRLDNTTQAHIHLAPAGENGPVVAWLYPSGPPPVPIPGEFNGVLGEGTLTAESLVGPLEGEPLSRLIEEMRAGNTYVNVHSQQFPPGEIRGQIFPAQVIDFTP